MIDCPSFLLDLIEFDGIFIIIIIMSVENLLLNEFELIWIQLFIFKNVYISSRDHFQTEKIQVRWNFYFTFSSIESNCDIWTPLIILALNHVVFKISKQNWKGFNKSTKYMFWIIEPPIKYWMKHCEVWLTLIWLRTPLINIHRENNNIRYLLSNMRKLENMIMSEPKSYK